MAEHGVDDLLVGLRAAAEATRLRLLALCAEHELTVSELTQIVGQSQPRVSRHLKLLCGAGLLERFTEGSWAFYRCADVGPGGALARALLALVPGADEVLRRDRERLAAVDALRRAKAAAYFRANAERWNEIRSLYVDEAEVEAALVALLGDGPVTDFLDIGTGTGRMLEIFAPHVGRGTGIDLSREMLTIARANLARSDLRHCQVRHGDMYCLALPDASFDLVTVHQVLHFADRPAAVIAEAARLLRAGGRLVIVDFAPHKLDFLREQDAHRRLGFADAEVVGWCRANGLAAETPRHLAGRQLTVALWVARRPQGAENARRAAE